MKCVFCGQGDCKVNETRTCDDDLTVRRRRECVYCGKRFTTFEKPESIQIYVVKKDGRREVFDSNKISQGMIKSCEKLSISMEQIQSSLDSVTQKVNQAGTKEVTSDFVANLVMDELKKLDLVAYIRFASVYMRFGNIQTFREEVEKIILEHEINND